MRTTNPKGSDMEIVEMPWYNNHEIEEIPAAPEKGNLVTRLRSKVSKKVVVAAAATAGLLAATAAVIAKSRSGQEDSDIPQEDAEMFEFPTTDQVEEN